MFQDTSEGQRCYVTVSMPWVAAVTGSWWARVGSALRWGGGRWLTIK